jgi:SnoaL-like domain
MSHGAFRAAVEAGDHAGMVAALAPDVVFHSPVTFRPFEGRDAVAMLFAVLLETFEDFRYTDEIDGDALKALVFEARVGDRQVQGLDLLRFDDRGLIADFTVMVRPLTGAMALAEAVGKGLEQQASEGAATASG